MDHIDELAQRMHGSVVRREESEYEEARRIWNASIDRRPALVARCASESDIAVALEYGQAHELAIAVRGGGHSVAGMGTCEDGLMITLDAISSIEVDPHARLVRVGGGALLGAVDAACQAHSLATPAGVVSHTGVGGLTLGGGVGWLTRKHGLTCDNMIAARVVTPTGEVVTASEDEEPELLWGLRGGGGNFGVVSEFTFRAHPVPRVLPVGFGVWALGDAPALLARYRELMPQQPDEVKATVFFVRAHAQLGVPPERIGEPVVAVVQPWIGEDGDAAERAFSPLLDAAKPIRAEVRPTRWLELQRLEDDVSGHGKGNYTKGGYLDAIDDQLIHVMSEGALSMPGPACQIEVIPHGGAQTAVGEHESAFSNRDAPYSFNVYSRWSLSEDGERHVAWARGVYAAMRPYAGAGVYTNFFAFDDGQDRVMAAYGPQKYARLARLKRRYDPGNALALNQNILPVAADRATPVGKVARP